MKCTFCDLKFMSNDHFTNKEINLKEMKGREKA